ncbi:hypothetical protein LSTR_LSTR014440 [Laodelphax striatellus]|uniref:Uncharacterized protein n=1 Tax=Laodelphax striatellus TaxID=195883 RepID=A0A482XNU1_LAOST|nr:hypothetical protein LSTR_LSTR014440 [Laodelphax striatellus]
MPPVFRTAHDKFESCLEELSSIFPPPPPPPHGHHGPPPPGGPGGHGPPPPPPPGGRRGPPPGFGGLGSRIAQFFEKRNFKLANNATIYQFYNYL